MICLKLVLITNTFNAKTCIKVGNILAVASRAIAREKESSKRSVGDISTERSLHASLILNSACIALRVLVRDVIQSSSDKKF